MCACSTQNDYSTIDKSSHAVCAWKQYSFTMDIKGIRAVTLTGSLLVAWTFQSRELLEFTGYSISPGQNGSERTPAVLSEIMEIAFIIKWYVFKNWINCKTSDGNTAKYANTWIYFINIY